MNAINLQNSRLLGFVQVQVGPRTYALPVQAVHFVRDERDGEQRGPAGGFFTEDAPGQYGIVVDGDASDSDVQAQILRASEDAVRHFSKKFLN